MVLNESTLPSALSAAQRKATFPRMPQSALRFDAPPQPHQHRNGGTTMFDPKSDYALNKMAPDAIVYKNAAGEVTRLTQAD